MGASNLSTLRIFVTLRIFATLRIFTTFRIFATLRIFKRNMASESQPPLIFERDAAVSRYIGLLEQQIFDQKIRVDQQSSIDKGFEILRCRDFKRNGTKKLAHLVLKKVLHRSRALFLLCAAATTQQDQASVGKSSLSSLWEWWEKTSPNQVLEQLVQIYASEFREAELESESIHRVMWERLFPTHDVESLIRLPPVEARSLLGIRGW
jgi:hypothetical protein